MAHVNVTAKFEVRSFTCSWDNMGYLKTFGSPVVTRTLPFLQYVKWSFFCWDGPCECSGQIGSP